MDVASPRNTKLVSLLGLSAGAAALPQSAEAQIVYSGTIDFQVSYSSNSSYTLNLPGTNDLMLYTELPYIATNVQFGANSYVGVRTYGGTGTNAAFAARSGAGATWDMIGGAEATRGIIGGRVAGTTGAVQGPGSFSNQYVAFRFQDTDSGNADRYGWALLSMTVGTGTGPDAILHSYAYDASGAKIAMGATAIPEPATSAAIAAMGALALGGVRRWRQAKKERVAATTAASA